ncbi:CHAP domain-containing protein [Staphylococcus warneri]|jgi:surface antigen|uniref:CHAP domain-containing protein n=1 Tax=Staphylococcus TaxID=1279 RepID=UPI0001A5CD53|nr:MULTISPECIES: CHAP domain-containing protein [Staphylococcus]MBE9429211.1 CHAP domain-containing protein [Staphylococcus epidermidis]AXV41708.1 secretory antigen SsaA [Staphylococcus sp. M0911]EEQ80900.1 CHAP domain protein [Staphylococcus warneri L37603]MBO0377441.1 CHAP domain-containing protein [Staphylococcus warneri]MCD8804366.1 CHAP domain-containing protein [Staphylococcus warneri]
MKKIATITTLTAGIGAAYFGTTDHHADAAEFNQSNNQSYNYNTTQTSTSNTTSERSASGNLYTAGQCTWYVYDKVGGKVGSTWGDARNWASAAQQAGYTVNHTPKAGSILQSSAGGYGHVAYVESVGSDGSVTVSEMNYSGGPFSVSTRTISAGEASSYNYIHI